MHVNPAFLVGDPDSDHLEIEILGWLPPDDSHVLDCRVRIQAAGTFAEYRASLPPEAFSQVRDNSAQLHRAFKPGSVVFSPGRERSIEFEYRIGETGQAEVSGIAIDGIGTGWEQQLRFRFLVGDSPLAVSISASRVADAFPAG